MECPTLQSLNFSTYHCIIKKIRTDLYWDFSNAVYYSTLSENMTAIYVDFHNDGGQKVQRLPAAGSPNL